MPKEKILVVDDEEDILELVKYNLEREGYSVSCVESGEDCLTATRREPPDLILLDLMLPGIDGLDVCKALKRDEKVRDIPIIMLTAKGEESDIVTGLELGADDYVPKPFSPKVLNARIKAVLRRSHESGEDAAGAVLKRGSLEMDPGRRETRLDGAALELTFSEFEILFLLAKRPGWVFTRGQIVNGVRGHDYPVTERAIDVQIVSIRKKLGERASLIETIRGVGYKFKS